MKSRLMVAAVLVAGTALAPYAEACRSSSLRGRLAGPKDFPMILDYWDPAMPRTGPSAAGKQEDDRSNQRNAQIVGLWITNFYIGNTTELYDKAIEQFFADGNELMNSALFPPWAGNVCFGTWKAVNGKSFKLTHIGWTFDKEGNLEGTARIFASMTVSPQGDTFVGTFTADIIDTKGNVMPGSAAQGVIKASRVMMN